MENAKSLQLNTFWSEVLFYTAGLALVYLTPVLSHLFAIPLYYLEPMRIMVILSLVFKGRYSSYVLALTLPAFSYLVSGHPVFYKAGVMTFELILNILLFDLLRSKIKNYFIAVSASILLSKLVYYLFKYVLISYGLLSGQFISTPIVAQLLVIILLGLTVSYLLNRSQGGKN